MLGMKQYGKQQFRAILIKNANSRRGCVCEQACMSLSVGERGIMSNLIPGKKLKFGGGVVIQNINLNRMQTFGHVAVMSTPLSHLSYLIITL